MNIFKTHNPAILVASLSLALLLGFLPFGRAEFVGVVLADEQTCTDSGGTWGSYLDEYGVPVESCNCPSPLVNAGGYCVDSTEPPPTGGTSIGFTPVTYGEAQEECAGVWLGISVGCDENNNNPILAYTAAIVNFLAAGVGVVIAIMLTVASIQYITARGKPDLIEAAKKKIINTLIALGMFIFMYSLLQWLIPGGIF
jgi:hypothetical protein